MLVNGRLVRCFFAHGMPRIWPMIVQMNVDGGTAVPVRMNVFRYDGGTNSAQNVQIVANFLDLLALLVLPFG